MPGIANAQLLFSCGFEDGVCNLSEIGDQGDYPGNARETVTDGTARSGSKYLRTARGSQDCNTTGDFNDCAHVQYSLDQLVPLQYETEYWIGGSFRIPAGTTVPYSGGDNFLSLEDLHGNQCPDYWTQSLMHYFTNSSPNNSMLFFGGSNSSCSSITYEGGVNYNVTLGNWTDFALNIKISKNGTGFIYYYINKVLIYSQTGISTAFYDSPPFWKFGNYMKEGPAAVDWDDIKVGNASSSLDEVSPGGGTPDPDTEQPVIRNPSPNGTVAQGTQNQIESVETSEPATCRHSDTSGFLWASGTAFTSTGGFTHTWTRTGLSDGQSVNTYVLCQDASANQSDQGQISYTVDTSSGGATNLINANTFESGSDTLSGTDWCQWQYLWDGNTSYWDGPSAVCNDYTVAPTLTGIWAFGTAKDLTSTEYWGGSIDWGTSTYDIDIMHTLAGGWVNVFTGRDGTDDDWDVYDATALDAVIKVRLTIHGIPGSGGTLGQEFRVFGVNAQGGSQPPASPGKGSVITLTPPGPGGAPITIGVPGGVGIAVVPQQ